MTQAVAQALSFIQQNYMVVPSFLYLVIALHSVRTNYTNIRYYARTHELQLQIWSLSQPTAKHLKIIFFSQKSFDICNFVMVRLVLKYRQHQQYLTNQLIHFHFYITLYFIYIPSKFLKGYQELRDDYNELKKVTFLNLSTNICKVPIGFSTLHPCMSKDVQRLCLGQVRPKGSISCTQEHVQPLSVHVNQ